MPCVVSSFTGQSICRSRPLHEFVHGDDDDRAARHVGTSLLFVAGRELVGFAHSNHAAVAAAIAVSTVRARASTRDRSLSSVDLLFVARLHAEEDLEAVRSSSTAAVRPPLEISAYSNVSTSLRRARAQVNLLLHQG